MANTKRSESATREFFLDLLHLMWTFAASGCRVPPSFMLDRRAYESVCRAQERRVAWEARERLREQRLITITERGDQVSVALTTKGKLEGLKLYILHAEHKMPKGMCCLVSFDIPEVTRSTRRFLRNFLKEAKFERVHHSLWKSHRDVVMPLRELTRTLHIQDWVRVFRAHID